MAELVATLPRLLEPQPTWKVTASHNSDNAANALSLRAWSSGVPQEPGMWLQVELTQPAMLTEIQFDSGTGRGFAGGTVLTAPTAGRGGPASAPVIGYPRGYRVQVSMDGTKWSAPVAEAKGAGPRTVITFKPVQAKFVRLTQTDTVENAPVWSMLNVRLYETVGK
jgi:hypothetical protein